MTPRFTGHQIARAISAAHGYVRFLSGHSDRKECQARCSKSFMQQGETRRRNGKYELKIDRVTENYVHHLQTPYFSDCSYFGCHRHFGLVEKEANFTSGRK